MVYEENEEPNEIEETFQEMQTDQPYIVVCENEALVVNPSSKQFEVAIRDLEKKLHTKYIPFSAIQELTQTQYPTDVEMLEFDETNGRSFTQKTHRAQIPLTSIFNESRYHRRGE